MVSTPEIEQLRIEFEREKWRGELSLREKEVAIKKREQIGRQAELRLKIQEQRRSRWTNPLVLGVFAAAVAASGNAIVVLLNGYETHRADLTKAESDRILTAIKTDSPDKAATNLKFLLEAGLIDSPTKAPLEKYLKDRKQGEGATLPAAITSTSSPQQTVAITESPNLQDGGQTTSLASFTNTKVTFLNLTSNPVQLYWVDFSGAAQLYTSITPGASAYMETYAGHLWVAKTQRGVELLRYVVKGPPPAGPLSQSQSQPK